MRYTARPALFSARRILRSSKADESPPQNFAELKPGTLSSSSVAFLGHSKKALFSWQCVRSARGMAPFPRSALLALKLFSALVARRVRTKRTPRMPEFLIGLHERQPPPLQCARDALALPVPNRLRLLVF